tara:strand:- start:78 stop:206 length:129 start_codon:yes stop_codon:yes gene_type:complete
MSSGGSIVPNNNPNIGIINEIENREKITDKVLKNVFSKNRTQ